MDMDSGKGAMNRPIRILLQTTIPPIEGDWHVGRFSLLAKHLSNLRDGAGNVLCEVTCRDRDVGAGEDDSVLSNLETSDFDELWLFAVDAGEGLSAADCEGITRFRQRGGGLFSTRDHQDLGSSLCTLGGVGRAHFFHSKNPEPDESRRTIDDTDTSSILWPNYHSGRNGDFHKINVLQPAHELLRNFESESGFIEQFPSHPHEGAVGVPPDEENARVIAAGTSLVTGRPFNLVVAFESAVDDHGNTLGRAVAESSFHHFADYNWDTKMGCPSFLTEPPGDGFKRHPEALNHIRVYARNLAIWLAG